MIAEAEFAPVKKVATSETAATPPVILVISLDMSFSVKVSDEPHSACPKPLVSYRGRAAAASLFWKIFMRASARAISWAGPGVLDKHSEGFGLMP